MVVVFAPAPIVPVVVPPTEPVPDATERETFEAPATLLAAPHGSGEVTVTEKLVFLLVGVATTGLFALPRVGVIAVFVPAASAGVPLVWVAVRETPASATE